jgi:hypothetical protein
VRGGFGNPLKTIETTDSVQEEVTRAFRDAVQRRGLLVGPGDGATDLAMIIRRLDCSQYVRREAQADFRVLLTDREGRRCIRMTCRQRSSMAAGWRWTLASLATRAFELDSARGF